MPEAQRSEVWLVDLGYTGKVRPSLILSVPPLDTDRDLVTFVGHTTSMRGSQFEVPIQTRFLKPGAFDAQNLVTAPRAKLIRRLGKLTAEQTGLVEAAVLRWLGISDS